MPFAIRDQVYEDELHYTASLLGIELPKEDTSSTTTPTGTTLPADALKSQEGTQVPDNTNASPERYQTWPEKMVRGAISAMALPGDVLSGKVQPGSPQEIERAFDLAGLMVFGPAPVASKLADGTLGSFAGVTSKTLDRNRLAEAQIMEHNGASADSVWEKTGFFRGADDRWRFEIPDAGATLNEDAWRIRNPLKGDGSGESTKVFDVPNGGTTLGEALNHPELFKAYPHLKDIKIKPLPRSLYDRNVIGQMFENTMYLKDGLDPEYLRSVVLHELQHSIQRKEGFARGGNSLEFKSPALAEAEERFNKVKADTENELMKTHGWSSSDLRQRKDLIRTANASGEDSASAARLNLFKDKHPDTYNRLKDIVTSEDLLREQAYKQTDQYRRLMGEVEARNVQTRRDFNESIRKFTIPKATEDIPRDQQIFRN